MEFFRIKRDIPFMRHALVFNVISLITFLAAVFFLWHKGLHLSIEFTGGTVVEVSYPHPANVEGIRKTVEGLGFSDVQAQSFGTAQDVMIRLPSQKGMTSGQLSDRVMDALKAQAAPMATRDPLLYLWLGVGGTLIAMLLLGMGLLVGYRLRGRH